MAIEVIKPGLATTIQDAGRPGYYNIGIPLSGALDQYALRVANLLVGNEESAAVLEATLLAPELVFRAPAIVAIAGAERPLRSTESRGRATSRLLSKRTITSPSIS
jgi:allophanate hydrolase subunit 2